MRFTKDDIAGLPPAYRREVELQMAKQALAEAQADVRVARAIVDSERHGSPTQSQKPSKPPERPTGQRRGAGEAAKPQVHPLFAAMLADAGLPVPEPEYRFYPDRRWRLDYAFVYAKVAVEVEGGVWSGGRHTRGAGFMADLDKYNKLAALGWRLIRVTPDQLCTVATMKLIRETLTSAVPPVAGPPTSRLAS